MSARSRFTRNRLALLLIAFCLIIISAAVLLSPSFFNKPTTAGSEQHDAATSKISPKTPAAQANAKPQAYVAKADGFSIVFPQNPTVSQDTSSQDGQNIPLTSYSVETDNDHHVYYVSVSHYPDSISLPDAKTSLLGAADGMASAVDDAKRGEATYTTIGNSEALDSSYSGTINGQPETVYARHIMKDRTLYTLFTIGKTQSEFTAFVNSFSFL